VIFTETKLKDAYIIDIQEHGDERGFFARSWCRKEFEEHGLNSELAQCNISFSHTRGTVRGMHYQVPPYAEDKLLRCTRGAIYDVMIDLRPESATYMQWVAAELTEQNHRMLYVPEGFAHGFQALEDRTEVTYQVSQFYTPGAEQGVRYNDPAFGIEWPIEARLISEKDRNWPDYKPQISDSALRSQAR
jgi:dTDP-4-dehydrorhamnose 3,5-epimerase